MSARVALALDVGGTKLEAALVDEGGTVLAGSRHRRPTGRDATPDSFRTALGDAVAATLGTLPAGVDLLGVGVGSAGPVDVVAGTIAPVNMPGIHGFPLVAATTDAVGAVAPVRMRHDGACIALAESWLGATVGARASMAIVVSTGVGGGFVLDGRPLAGASGNAGHLGQTHAGGLTLEETASGPASAAWARSQGWDGETGEDLARAAAGGDRIAREAIVRSATAVGIALADAATLIDLDAIAVGGGFSRVSDDYVELVAAAARDAAALPYAADVRIVRSGLRDEGPLIGAAALVLRDLPV